MEVTFLTRRFRFVFRFLTPFFVLVW